MALYTSYYARQLSLRPETIEGESPAVEGDKNVQKAVVRRTVDLNGPYLEWIRDASALVRRPSDVPGLLGNPVSTLHMLPPVAYTHQPASNIAVKFAAQAPSKTRSSVNTAVWMPDGRRCMTGTQAGEFCMWGGQTFHFETIIQAHETPVRSIVFTHGGNFLVSGDDAGNVRYWKTNLELVKSTPAHKDPVRQVSFAPTDLKFATASDDSTLRVWDFARVTSEHVLAGHGGDVKSVHWHPSNSLLVSGSKDALVKLWCARSGKSVATMHGHKGTITSTQWNGNGNWVLSSSRDQTCKVFDVRMQAEIATYAGHAADITQACWHPLQEDLFVSGGHDGSLCFWLAGRSAPQAKVPGAHEGSIWSLAWHPAGHLLTSGSADTTTKFWCRSRPGDPFFEQQQAAQADMDDTTGEQPDVVTKKTPVVAPPISKQVQAIPGLGTAPKSMVSAPKLPRHRTNVEPPRALPVRGGVQKARSSVTSGRGRGGRTTRGRRGASNRNP